MPHLVFFREESDRRYNPLNRESLKPGPFRYREANNRSSGQLRRGNPKQLPAKCGEANKKRISPMKEGRAEQRVAMLRRRKKTRPDPIGIHETDKVISRQIRFSSASKKATRSGGFFV